MVGPGACRLRANTKKVPGPAHIALARRYNLDSRDEGLKQRLPVIADSEGVWECSFVGECSVVCPKGVDPAKAIQQTKLDTTLPFTLPYGNPDYPKRRPIRPEPPPRPTPAPCPPPRA